MIRAPMQLSPAPVRAGVTLIEVLVSIFIMGVGLLALLTLFPLGALTMDQAIKADRAGHCGRNAYSIMMAKNGRRDTAYFNTTAPVNPGDPPLIDSFTDPNPPAPGGQRWPVISEVPGAYSGPTYPVLVDPWGMLAGGANPQPIGVTVAPTGTFASPGIPRRRISFVSNRPEALRWFSLQDDMDFEVNGTPKVIGGAVQRSNRFTWAVMLRRLGPDDTDWVEMAVVVYHSRPLSLTGGEQAYTGSPQGSGVPIIFDPDSNSVRVEWNPAVQDKPAVRKGSWILDATVLDANGNPNPHGFYYRVVNITEVPAVEPGWNAVILELQDRPRKATNRGVLVVAEYVLDVFDEGLGWKP